MQYSGFDQVMEGTILPAFPPAHTPCGALRLRGGRVAALTPPDSVPDFPRVILPGFNDAHVHVWKVGALLTEWLDVRGIDSMDGLCAALREFAAARPGDSWLFARGYNEALFAEGRHPTRADLDAAIPDRPVLMIRTCAHIAVANSRALEISGIDAGTTPPPGGEIERGAGGNPTGLLRETAVGLVQQHLPPPTRERYERMILAGCHHLASLGVTSATDPAVHPELLDAYRALDARGELPIRINAMAIRRPDGGTQTYPLPEKHVSPFLRVDSVKFFADGGLSGATAALRVPYRHDETRGVLRFGEDELFDLAREAHIGGYRIGTHAIGDEAIDQVLRVYERLGALGPGARHRIEHFGLPDAGHLRRMAEGRFIAVPQAIFLRELGANFRRYLPPAYLERAYPLRAMLDAGIEVALSTDAPVVRDASPFAGIQSALLRRDASGQTLAPGQAIGINEALRAYTLGGAIASGDGDNRGTLAPGKWADFVVLNANPLATRPEELGAIRVEETWVAGRRVYPG
jgi:predicted amidohydrolase YtcJ